MRTITASLVVIALQFAEFGCGPPRQCSILIDCNCNCTNGGAYQVSGQACVAEAHEGECADWAAPKREATEAACIASCEKKHGDPTATCQLAALPGNPVVTFSTAACPVRR